MLASAPAAPLQPVRGDNAESNPWALRAGGPPMVSLLSFLFCSYSLFIHLCIFLDSR